MKKTAKLIVSLVLVAAILIPGFSFLASSASNNSDVPVIYLQGYGATIRADKDDPNSEVLWPIADLNLNYLMEKIDGLNPIFAKAYINGDYTDYCNYIYDAYAPLFERLKLDENGEVSDNSGVYFPWRKNGIYDKKRNGGYSLYDYEFSYDWRKSPYDIAEELHDYINAVKTATGSEKFTFVSRCFGCNIVAAYLDKYGTDDIVKCVFNSSAALGSELIDMLFAGKIKIESEGLERYAYDLLPSSVLYDFIKASISLAEETHMIDGVSLFVDSVYVKVMDNLVPRLITCSFGSFPGFWAMTNEHFEESKNFHYGNELEKYAGLISKIDNYHYNAQANLKQTIADSLDKVDYYNLTKYGYQFMPVHENSAKTGDNTVNVEEASFGATSSDDCSKPLPKKYLNSRIEAGYERYISPDSMIDASTALLPDKTWFVKNIRHDNFDDGLHEVIKYFVFTDGVVDITTSEAYPQFLQYIDETDTIIPLTKEDAAKTRWNEDNFFGVFVNWVKKFKVFMDEIGIPYLREKIAEKYPDKNIPMPY